MSNNQSPKSDKVCEGVGSWIVSTAHSFRRALECQLSEQGITFRQWEVLAWLVADGEQPQNELADKMGLEAQTMAGIISRMERDGWLNRKCCSADRRRKLINSTDQAKKIWDEMSSCCEEVKQQAIQGIREDELDLLKRLCERIRNNLGDCESPSQLPDNLCEQTKEKSSASALEDTHCGEETLAPGLPEKNKT